MPQLCVSTQGGKPVPWGSTEQAWRKTLADSARERRAPAGDLRVSKESKFVVDIVFRMTEAHVKHVDLDNLAKPVLDTLFLSSNAQVKDKSLTGALFNLDDDRVFKLNLEKRLVVTSEEEGVDVTIAW